MRCVASKLGSDPRASPGFLDWIWRLVCLTPVTLIRAESRPTRTTRRLIQEFGSRFLDQRTKVKNENGVPACPARLVGCAKTSIQSLSSLAITSKSVVNAKPQWAVDWAEASERTVSIRDGGRLKTWSQASLAGSSASCHPVVAVAVTCTRSKA